MNPKSPIASANINISIIPVKILSV